MYTRLRLGGKKDNFYRDVVQFIWESNSIIIELSVSYYRNKLLQNYPFYESIL